MADLSIQPTPHYYQPPVAQGGEICINNRFGNLERVWIGILQKVEGASPIEIAIEKNKQGNFTYTFDGQSLPEQAREYAGDWIYCINGYRRELGQTQLICQAYGEVQDLLEAAHREVTLDTPFAT